MNGGNLISDGFRDDLYALVRQSRNQTQQQRARAGYDGIVDAQRPIAVRPVPFELKADLSPTTGSQLPSAQAYLLAWSGTSLEDRKDSDENPVVVTVYDLTNRRRAKGRDAAGTGASIGAGAQGWMARILPPAFGVDAYAILDIRELARRCRATTTASVAKTDASFTVNTVAPIDDGQNPVTTSSDTLTIANRYKWDYDSGAPIGIEYDASAQSWVPYVGGCKGDWSL
jgi:hypothetical protein